MTTLEIDHRHLELLRQKRIFLNSSGAFEKTWISGRYNASGIVMMESYSAQYKAGRLTSLGAFTYSRSSLPAGVTVGRYCALADGIAVMGTSHPVTRVGLGGFDYAPTAPFAQYASDLGVDQRVIPGGPELAARNVVIGDDVWIGSDVLLSRNVTIGQGAVIAARSVVTKDVPPYALVAGVPATVKKYRFPETIVERLLASQWTDYAFTDFADFDTTQPERFLDDFEGAKADGKVSPLARQPFDVHSELRSVPVLEAQPPTEQPKKPAPLFRLPFIRR